MPPQYQKMILTILQRWQRGCNITIGPFEELNYETASNVSTGRHQSYPSKSPILFLYFPVDEEDLFDVYVTQNEHGKVNAWQGKDLEQQRIDGTETASFPYTRL